MRCKARVRAFIDLAVEMVADNPAYLLTPKELAAHGPAVQKKPRARKPTP